MINRQNWKIMKEYLDYRKHVDQISSGSLNVEKVHMRYLLYWANEQSFKSAPTIRPTLQEYLTTGVFPWTEKKMQPEFYKKNLCTARRFFSWLIENKTGYRTVKRSWINTLKTKRITDVPRNKEAVSLDEIMAIATAPVENIKEERIRATAVMLYLSGIRIGAFVSLPIQAVDIAHRTVKQYPSLGVRTKFRKHGNTYLLDIPELLAVVRSWDTKVRAIFPEDGPWFPPLCPETGEIDRMNTEIGEHRESVARKNLRDWLAKVGLPYHSPHKFRHGHIHFGLSHARTMADFKAVSQNAMHSSTNITDQFYSNQNETDVRDRISALGKAAGASSSDKEDFELFQQFLEWRRGR